MTKSHVAVSASDYPTPKQMKEFYLQVESGKMTKDRFQKTLRGTDWCPPPSQECPFFANEEVSSNYGYPEGYVVKPVEWQAEILTRSFQDNLGILLDAGETIAYARDLPQRSFCTPVVSAKGGTTVQAVNCFLNTQMLGSVDFLDSCVHSSSRQMCDEFSTLPINQRPAQDGSFFCVEFSFFLIPPLVNSFIISRPKHPQNTKSSTKGGL
ncbi:MAG: hypothetical protein A3D65_00890 [Candidatus Lloydbacteria bacterium RIFCSPHIGHO2_02_FULL_50_13]|uniref:Uncharacterized protein n=1 Tax=Candidatus Lloydbacteria bacterium RIFCSPHIGHO2_02_FULL_50_13 TaxID=1798661 RepID=A0A1G2D4K3_9BACT|nr:MAG: hypothetical protein A3D65_00890 [Candidatus Lloydbacteria bacterium RIFCSPHIGHO2_02_FULL_50_13]